MLLTHGSARLREVQQDEVLDLIYKKAAGWDAFWEKLSVAAHTDSLAKDVAH